MARSKFNMNTLVKVADAAVASRALAAEKNPGYCHALLLKRVIEAGDAGITCQDLYTWLESQKAALMAPAMVATWDKYSPGCHLSYFVNRCRGSVVATLDGKAVAQTPTKVKKAKAEAPAAEPVAEPVTAEEAALEEAGA